MICEEVLELSGAFALDAVSPDEEEAVRGHVAACAGCRLEIEKFMEVVALLPYASAERRPPEALKGRVLAAVQADTGRVIAFPGARDELSRKRGASAALPSRRPSWQTYVPLAAAAAFLAVMLAGGSGFRLWSEQPRTYALHGNGYASASSGHLVYVPAERASYASFTNLPDPGQGRAYQLWLIKDGKAVSEGLIRPDSTGSATAKIAPVKGFDVFAVTVEPDWGPPSPTGDLVVTEKL